MEKRPRSGYDTRIRHTIGASLNNVKTLSETHTRRFRGGTIHSHSRRQTKIMNISSSSPASLSLLLSDSPFKFTLSTTPISPLCFDINHRPQNATTTCDECEEEANVRRWEKKGPKSKKKYQREFRRINSTTLPSCVMFRWLRDPLS